MASFEAQIKPLFRPEDRMAMQYAFDLWSYDDVVDYSDDILARLEDGTMPCDEPWDDAKIDVFRTWVEEGMDP